jgi:hypothetical protein
MIDDVREIIERGNHSLHNAFPEIRKLASSEDWERREDAATALVEISKKKEDEVVNEMMLWVEDKDPNIRRGSLISIIIAHVAMDIIAPLLG